MLTTYEVDLLTFALCILCVLLGWAAGYRIGKWSERRADRAPAPERRARANTGSRPETVVVCGREWHVMRPAGEVMSEE